MFGLSYSTDIDVLLDDNALSKLFNEPVDVYDIMSLYALYAEGILEFNRVSIFKLGPLNSVEGDCNWVVPKFIPYCMGLVSSSTILKVDFSSTERGNGS